MSADALYAAQLDLLDFCALALDVLPAGAPERRYVSFGLPALDCEQLTVHVFGVRKDETAYSGSPDPGSLRRKGHPLPAINMLDLVITIARECYPGPVGPAGGNSVPDVPDLVEASQMLHADGWQLWNAVNDAVRAGVLYGACQFVSLLPMQPLGPEGNFAGWTLPVSVNLDGFDPSPPA